MHVARSAPLVSMPKWTCGNTDMLSALCPQHTTQPGHATAGKFLMALPYLWSLDPAHLFSPLPKPWSTKRTPSPRCSHLHISTLCPSSPGVLVPQSLRIECMGQESVGRDVETRFAYENTGNEKENDSCLFQGNPSFKAAFSFAPDYSLRDRMNPLHPSSPFAEPREMSPSINQLPKGRRVPKKLREVESRDLASLPLGPPVTFTTARLSPLGKEPREEQLAKPCLGKGTRTRDSMSFQKQHIKVQTAHTCSPIALAPTAQAHFSLRSRSEEQNKNSELRDRILGHREPAEGKADCGEKLPRKEAAQDCHMPGPLGPPSQCCKIPVGVVGGKGPLHLHPLPRSKPVRGLWDEGIYSGEAEHFGRPRQVDHLRSGVQDQSGQHALHL
ncbi:hypothetical protein AAY473_029028 [Plecturocebus cupreus]